MRKILLLLVLFVTSSIALHAQIYSTLAGGEWSDSLTWVGHTPPDGGQSVVIQGPVQVDNTCFAQTLTITETGSVSNRPNGNYTLYIQGDLINYGSVGNGASYTLTVSLFGDFTNYGQVAVYQLLFETATTHELFMDAGALWAGTNVVFNSTNGSAYLLTSDVTFSGTNWQMNAIPVYLNGHNLTVAGSYLTNATVIGTGTEYVIASPSMEVVNAVYQSLHMSGEHNVQGGAFTDVVNHGVLQNRANGNSYMYFYGMFENHGSFRNNSSGYIIYAMLYGDLANTGVFNVYELQLHDVTPHHVLCPPASPVVANTISQNGAGVILAGESVIHGASTNASVDLNGFNLTYSDCYIWNVAINGGDGETVTFVNDSYIVNAEIHDIMLAGEWNCMSGVLLYDVFNMGVLQNFNTNNYSVEIHGSFENNGEVRNNPGGYLFYVNLYDNLVNNGVWDIYQLTFAGAADQHISSAGCVIEADYVGRNTDHNIILDSDVELHSNTIDLTGDQIVLSGYDLTYSGRLYNGDIVGLGPESVTCIDGYDQIIAFSNLTLDGVHSFYGSDCVGVNVVNDGVLQNHNTGSYTFSAQGLFVNNGEVRSNPNGYLLSLNLDNDFESYGVVDIYTLNLVGAAMQTVTTAPGDTLHIDYLDCANTIGVTLGSDLNLQGTTCHFHDTQILLNGSNLSYSGGQMRFAVITGGGGEQVSAFGDSYDQNVQFHNVSLVGVHSVYGDAVGLHNVTNNGVLQNWSSGSYTVNVDGDFTNNGEARGNPNGYTLSLTLDGDIVNNGAWSIQQLTLDGAVAQTISCPTGAALHCSYIDCNNSVGVNLESDLQIVGVDFDMHNLLLDLGGNTLDVDAAFHNAVIYGANSTLVGHAGLWQYLQCHEMTLQGQVACGVGVVLEDVVNEGLMRNFQAGTQTVTLEGTFVNYGEMANYSSSYHLNLTASGDIEQYGVWNTYNLNMAGDTQQTITAPDSAFTLSRLNDANSATPVYAGSDLRFINTTIDMNGGELAMMPPGGFAHNLAMQNGVMTETTLTGGPGVSFTADGVVSLSADNINDVTLYGEVKCGNGVKFTNLVNEGFIENDTAANYTVEFYGTTVNNGAMRKHPISHTLYIDIYGDLVQNGVVSLYRVRFMGDTPQTTTVAPGLVFDVDYLYSVNTADTLYWNGDIVLLGTRSDINTDTVIMGAGADLVVDGGYFIDALVYGDGDIDMSGAAYFTTSVFDGFSLRGEVRCRHNVTLRNVTIVDTLRNDPYSSYTVTLEGDCVNHGVIYDPANNLYLSINGDFYNDGVVDINRIDVNGVVDQEIVFEQGASINCATNLYSDIGTAAWYLDSNPLGLIALSMPLAAIDNTTLGLYNAENGGAWSRNIRIKTQPQKPQNLLVAVSAVGVTLTWDESLGAMYYIIEAADDPSGAFTVIEGGVFDPTPGDGVVEWTLPAPDTDRRYYRVTAAN